MPYYENINVYSILCLQHIHPTQFLAHKNAACIQYVTLGNKHLIKYNLCKISGICIDK